ncbi:hypothetical protein ACHHYP_02597 [Achlya hypogyna]|uniref:Secreted protein n=1 Tax=Achlya hypogyna TaxID=1202772 RepID=A0A1V9ZSN4_ACHHY|nr:hypothetical protein ACHHYP_02597 [Achlya hypogyna]
MLSYLLLLMLSMQAASAAPMALEPRTIAFGCGAAKAYPPPHRVTRFVIDEPTAEVLLVHFAKLHLAPHDVLLLRPRSSNTSRAMTPERITAASNGLGAFFSVPLYSTQVVVELRTAPREPTSQGCYGFVIDGVRTRVGASDRFPPGKESLCGADDSRNAACFVDSVMALKSKAVVRLLTNRASGSDFCSGWLLGCGGHVLTNQHCLLSADDAANTLFEFMAEGASCASDCEAHGACASRQVVRGGTLLASSTQFDYALVQLDEVPPSLGYLQLRAAGPIMHERVYIPQYPLGGGKRISVLDGKRPGTITSLTLSGCTTNQAGYMLDTQPGSSGSPVLAHSDQLVVALHHCGGCPNAGIQAQFLIKDLTAKGVLPPCAIGQ